MSRKERSKMKEARELKKYERKKEEPETGWLGERGGEEIEKWRKKEMKYAAEANETGKDQTALVCQEGILGCKGQNRKARKEKKMKKTRSTQGAKPEMQ